MREKVLEILINKIKRDYKDDVSVVVVMGSTIYQATHKKSDLDMYFVQKTARGYQLGTVFILDGIGYDVWPISWDRLEGISRHQERITSILTEGHVVYFGDDEDKNRFELLKERALDVSNIHHFIYLAKEAYKKLYEPMYQLMTSNQLSETRRASIHVINGLCHTISLLNRNTIKRGRAHLKHEIMSMALKPKHFDVCIDSVFESNDIETIKQNYKVLFDETRVLIQEQRQKHVGNLKDQASGFFEEIINNYNKIERGCEIKDYKTPLFAAVEIEHELSEEVGPHDVLKELPPLLDTYNQDQLDTFFDASQKHLKTLKEVFQKAGVSIRTFEDLKTLQTYIDSL